MANISLTKPDLNPERIKRLTKKLGKKKSMMLSLKIPTDIFLKFKSKCCFEQKSMTTVLIELISKYLDE